MLSNLSWLQPVPETVRDDFVSLKADIAAGVEGVAERIFRLAQTRLDESQLTRLAKISNSIVGSLPPFDRVRLGVLGDGTLSLLSGAIIGSGLRHGLLINVVEGAYGSAVLEATDSTSVLHNSNLDMALVALDYRLAGIDRASPTAVEAASQVGAAFKRIEMIVGGLRGGVTGPILVQTLVPPLEPLFGSFDRTDPGSVFAMVTHLNHRLAEWAREGAIILVDVARLAGSIGLEQWNDPRHWHASKLSFAPEYLPVYADTVVRVIGAVKGKAKKVLVLDLDNTLWGGIIGDDGLDGIKIGQGSATGEAFLSIQSAALELRARGIILAVCSKNEEDAARLPFAEHPDMLLREDHIAVFQANWTDKAANLRAIAKALNVGVDAMVFLDDNPAERAQVRRELPFVAVPELPADPALYPRTLASAGYFETVALSAEDRLRADLYQSDAARAEMLAGASDLDGYLNSLQMTCTISAVDSVSRVRVAQLINKSNQYNLTTRRYTEEEIARASVDPARHIAQIRLIDRFGDNGIISVLIADKRDAEWEIDTWLMSCRVLGRRVQEAALMHLASAAKDEGAARLVGRYIRSEKNRMVEDHYQKLGFSISSEADDDNPKWVLQLDGYQAPALPMRILDRKNLSESIVA